MSNSDPTQAMPPIEPQSTPGSPLYITMPPKSIDNSTLVNKSAGDQMTAVVNTSVGVSPYQPPPLPPRIGSVHTSSSPSRMSSHGPPFKSAAFCPSTNSGKSLSICFTF